MSGNNQDGNGKDPWGNRPDEGPPDLSDIANKLQENIASLFGAKRTNRNSGGGGRNHKKAGDWPIGFFIIPLLLWLVFDAVYFIDEQERGVVLRFGEHVDTIQPGINIRFPRPIEKVINVNVGQVRSITHKGSMLTQDENIVKVEVAVQWRIADPEKFLFNVSDPFPTLRQVAESAVREVIGKSKLDYVLTEGRSAVAEAQGERMRAILEDLYDAGIYILRIEMQPAKPPDEVKAAFDDAIKAREDEQRFVNEAEAYRNEIIPKARGGAARIMEESNGYKARIVAMAEGESKRFEQLLAEYQAAPEVTRQRLYLGAMESVLSSTGKVFMDSNQSNSLMYLPINELMQQNNKLRVIPPNSASGLSTTRINESNADNNFRSRETR